jgi:hypothetical protein
MSKARDLANAGTALGAVSATELGYVDGVTSAIQTQIDAKTAKSTLTTTGDIYYASSANTPARLGIGSSAQVLTVASGVPSWATPASGVTTFTQRVSTTESFNTIEYNGSNLYVAAGSSGVLYSSPDGITWTSRTSGFSTITIRKVAYGNGLWVAVGNSGTLTTSTDGITWTARTANVSTNTIYDVKYANSIWVAVAAGGGATNTGGIIYSTDGITWTRKSQSLTVGALYYSVVWNGTNWIVGATHSTNNYLYASTPSGTWTAGATGTNAANVYVFWDGTRHIAFDGNGGVSYSTSTTLGTVTNLASFAWWPTIGTVAYYNSKVIILGVTAQEYSTAPDANNRPIKTNSYISPTTLITTAGDLVSNIASVWLGATGTILCQTGGQLYTSF